VTIDSCRTEDFQGLLLPGGFMPDKLRRDPKVKDLIREFAEQKKCVAAICHGGWMAISAGVYRGIRVTGSLGIKDDLENAGAIWTDAPVVTDGHFVSSRKPDDLPYFVEAMIDVLSSFS
jgi:protease I